MEPAPERQPLWNRIATGAVIVIGLAVIAGFIWAIANAEAAVVTAAVALIIFAAGEFFTRGRAARQYRWDQIAPTYEEFIEHLRHTTNLTDAQRNSTKEQQRGEKTIGKFSDKLLLWGSPDVIKAWVAALRLNETDPDLEGTELVLAYARILLAIRQDLGHRDWTLEARDLLRVVIKDIDQHLPPGTRP